MKENMKNYAKKRELLIDGDIIIYKVALQEEQAIKWDENLWTLHAYEDKAIAAVDEAIKKLQRDLRCKPYKIALTSPNNFRKDVLPSYKANRKGVRKPMILPVLRQHVMDNHKGIMWDGLEADDVLGILATTADSHYDKDPVIVSIDKDFKQIPSLICLDGENIVRISRPAADYWFMLQVLMGDSVDGYTGLPSVGIKTAEKILGDKTTVPLRILWDKVVEAYEKKGYTEKEALQQARVAKILRATDYNKKKGEVKLWQIKR
jgi:DNA polymerase-1